MNITVILCTYNRCQNLGTTLESLAASILPNSVDWEVLVVDNNSMDRTREVVEDFGRRHPGLFRYVFEPRPGKSFALNTGVREAQGDVLAFTDDDVAVDTAWLQNLTAALENTEWAGTGGRTLPATTFSPPRWLTFEEPYALGGALCAHFDLGDVPCELDRPPYGANMAFKMKMFEEYGGFRTDLGPSPNGEIPHTNEDTEFGRRLLAAGERLRYEPSAVVYHPVPEDRLTKNYLLAWRFDLGRANIREVVRGRDIWGIPRHFLSLVKYGTVRLPLRTLRWMLSFSPPKRFYRKCEVWKTAGEIAELYRRSFGESKT